MRKMKDSGIEWIGQIPSDWDVKRLKYIVNTLYKGNGITKDEVFLEGNIECVRYGEIYSKYSNSFSECISLTKEEIISSPQYFSYGDILFAGTGELVEEIGKNIVYLGKNKCLAGGDIIIAKHSQNPSFLNYALNSSYCQYQKSKGKAKLKVVHITASQIGNILVFLPPIAEQQRIADFLDEKCGEIDSIRSDIQEQIDILNDYKKSVITEAVTKGLDPKVKLKDSGIKWVGKIPEHWNVSKMKYACSKITDFTASGSFADLAANVTYLDSPDYAMLIRTADLSKKREVQPIYIDKHAYEYLSNSNLFGGEILLSNIGSVGDVYYFEPLYEKCSLAPNAIMAISKKSSRYLYYFLSMPSAIEELRQIGGNAVQQKFNKTQLRQLACIAPPFEEQKAIASYLDEKCSEIDSAIEDKQKQLETLEDYKKSLIFEYVTGKKEVPA